LRYLWDTNVCIQHLRGNARVQARLATAGSTDVVLCSVVRAELVYGVFHGGRPQALPNLHVFLAQFKSLAFDDAAAELAGRIRADLASKGTPIGPYDLQIAAIALTHGLVVVSNNTAEFSRVVGLPIEDWQST
jgi:tRNA(fMet)-specific endonuclease VapC